MDISVCTRVSSRPREARRHGRRTSEDRLVLVDDVLAVAKLLDRGQPDRAQRRPQVLVVALRAGQSGPPARIGHALAVDLARRELMHLAGRSKDCMALLKRALWRWDVRGHRGGEPFRARAAAVGDAEGHSTSSADRQSPRRAEESSPASLRHRAAPRACPPIWAERIHKSRVGVDKAERQDHSLSMRDSRAIRAKRPYRILHVGSALWIALDGHALPEVGRARVVVDLGLDLLIPRQRVHDDARSLGPAERVRVDDVSVCEGSIVSKKRRARTLDGLVLGGAGETLPLDSGDLGESAIVHSTNRRT